MSRNWLRVTSPAMITRTAPHDPSRTVRPRSGAPHTLHSFTSLHARGAPPRRTLMKTLHRLLIIAFAALVAPAEVRAVRSPPAPRYTASPAYARFSRAMSSLRICIIASITRRRRAGSPSCIISPNTVGTSCHDSP